MTVTRPHNFSCSQSGPSQTTHWDRRSGDLRTTETLFLGGLPRTSTRHFYHCQRRGLPVQPYVRTALTTVRKPHGVHRPRRIYTTGGGPDGFVPRNPMTTTVLGKPRPTDQILNRFFPQTTPARTSVVHFPRWLLRLQMRVQGFFSGCLSLLWLGSYSVDSFSGRVRGPEVESPSRPPVKVPVKEVQTNPRLPTPKDVPFVVLLQQTYKIIWTRLKNLSQTLVPVFFIFWTRYQDENVWRTRVTPLCFMYLWVDSRLMSFDTLIRSLTLWPFFTVIWFKDIFLGFFHLSRASYPFWTYFGLSFPP